MSNMTETQSNDIEAFWQLEDAQKKVVSTVRRMMQQAKTRFEGGKDNWGVCTDVSLSMEMAEKIRGWAEQSMHALADCLRDRAPSWQITSGAYVRSWGLALQLNAERESDGDVFEDIDKLIEECFED